MQDHTIGFSSILSKSEIMIVGYTSEISKILQDDIKNDNDIEYLCQTYNSLKSAELLL